MCDIDVSLQTVLSARGWRAFCRSKIGLLHKIGAIAACQNHPSGCESAPKPRQLPCRAVRIRSLARALRELRGVLCASATAPGEGGRNAELIEFTHLLRSTDFIMWHCGVNRSGWAETAATPRAQSALGRRTGSPSARPGRCVGARVLRAQISCDRRGRIAPEVPPSDAKLPLNCRLLDGFVGIPPANLRVKPSASFCGIRITGALWFPHWAIAAVVLRAQK